MEEIVSNPYLLSEFKISGFEPWESGEFLEFENGLRISSTVVTRISHTNSEIIAVLIKAFHFSEFPEGINDIAVAVGDTATEALKIAIKVWLVGTFPVIYELFNQGVPNSKVRRISLATQNLESSEMSGWLMYTGALQAVGLNEETFSHEAKMALNNQIMQALSNQIAGILHERQLMWIKCSISRQAHPNNTIEGDCWLNNETWEDGFDVLIKLAESWQQNSELQIRRQFFILQPVVRSPVELSKILENTNAPKKKWWQFGSSISKLINSRQEGL